MMKTYDYLLININESGFPELLRAAFTLEDLEILAETHHKDCNHLIWINHASLEAGKIFK